MPPVGLAFVLQAIYVMSADCSFCRFHNQLKGNGVPPCRDTRETPFCLLTSELPE